MSDGSSHVCCRQSRTRGEGSEERRMQVAVPPPGFQKYRYLAQLASLAATNTRGCLSGGSEEMMDGRLERADERAILGERKHEG